MITNKLVDFDLLVTLHIDGEYTRWMIRAGRQFPVRIPGILTSANSALPFKFQELELVGTFPEHSLDTVFCFLICYC